MTEAPEVDVAVIGAGLAGLLAATELTHRGRSVAVIEARSRVGGRIRSKTIEGRVVELGGTFFSPANRRLVGLARNLGLTPRSTGLWGRRMRWLLPDGATSTAPAPWLGARGSRALIEAGLHARLLARRIDPERPWQGPTAIEADRLSVAEWLDRRRVRGRARWLISNIIGGYASQPVEELSLLQYLWWLSRHGGNFAALRNGNACYLAEGAQEVARRLAARLPEPPILETPVDSVDQDGGQVSIGSDGRLVCRARAAIVAVPIPTLGRIRFDPPLPESQADCVAGLRFGHLTKLGAAAMSEVRERHRAVVGGDPLTWSVRMESELVGYGLRSARGRPPQELLARLAADFGLRLDEIRGDAVDWSDEPYSGGSYVAFAPRQITRHGQFLAQPHGGVRFGGAERSTMPQQMEGALESGSRAGAETHSALRESRRPAEV